MWAIWHAMADGSASGGDTSGESEEEDIFASPAEIKKAERAKAAAQAKAAKEAEAPARRTPPTGRRPG